MVLERGREWKGLGEDSGEGGALGEREWRGLAGEGVEGFHTR